jgi:hypothetical protein
VQAQSPVLTPGKVHKQCDGDDRQTFTLLCRFGERPLTLRVILPATIPPAAVEAELIARAEAIVAMFLGTPFQVVYDGVSPADPDVIEASRHTSRVLRGG